MWLCPLRSLACIIFHWIQFKLTVWAVQLNIEMACSGAWSPNADLRFFFSLLVQRNVPVDAKFFK